MIAQTSRYGIGTTVPLDYERAVVRTKEALAAEGFGILSEIDVAATMKKKLDVVAALDPVEALQLTGNDDIRPLAEEVKTRLVRALGAVESAAG